MIDPYVYKNTETLINNLGIMEKEKLEQAESLITSLKILKIDESLKNEMIDFSYIQKIHKYIFEDIFPFAGEVRTIPIEKSEIILGGDTVRYAAPGKVIQEGEKILNRMDNTSWKDMNFEEKSLEYSKRIAELWQVHPFREGNTRTVMTFARHYAEKNGFPLDQEILKNNAAYVRNALVKASDGIYSEYGYLQKIMKESMENGKKIELKNFMEKELKTGKEETIIFRSMLKSENYQEDEKNIIKQLYKEIVPNLER